MMTTPENFPFPKKKCIRHGKRVECTQYHAEKAIYRTAKDATLEVSYVR